jgi:hypothetical protein
VSPSDFLASNFEVTMLLADAAQVADGKLFILGGGISLVGPGPTPMALAVLIKVPWDRANERHEWKVELLDEDFSPVILNEQPVLVGGTFEAGRPPGMRPGTPLDVPLAINFGPVPLPTGQRYTWRFSIDDTSEEGWRVSFTTRSNTST